MSNFYTNVKIWGNGVLYRGFHEGKKIQKKIEYKPSLYIPSNEQSEYKTLFGENLKRIKFKDIKEAKEFVKKYSDVENFKIYGNTNYEYCAISDIFVEDVQWDISNLRIAIVDIETSSDPNTGGFAKPDNPFQPIISIALKFIGDKKTYLFGYKDFNAPDDIIYIKCRDEYTLCKKFLEIWSLDYPDIASGWNSNFYDFPYIINRFSKIISEQETKRISPWNIIQERRNKKYVKQLGKYVDELTYNIMGISLLDYIDLFKKFQPGGNSQESYKLDSIAENEIGENKIEYEGSLHKLYTEDSDKFYLYNVKDVILVEKIDDKCRLFALGLTLAYDSKVNFEDIFQQTRMWDSLIYNHLRKKNIQVPQKVIGLDKEYEGAYVKPPITGFHNWIVTLDATSLYPSIIMGKNISPETLVYPENYSDSMKEIITKGVNVESLLTGSIDLNFLEEDKVTMTPNGQFFKTDQKGFLPEMIEKMFSDRQMYKKKMLSAQKELELVKSEIKTRGI